MTKLLFTNILSILFLSSSMTWGQSGETRPRRTIRQAAPAAAAPPASAAPTSPAAAAVAQQPAGSETTPTEAYSLLQQKQYAAAAKAAKAIAQREPKNSEAWKIAGFAEFNLKQYEEAAADLQKAYDLQRAENEEDKNTIDALAQAYIRTEKYDRALPLLVIATSRKGEKPDPALLYYRGLAEYRSGKAAEAEISFNSAIKADPKNGASLFYLGRIAFEKNDLTNAIALLNRATISEPTLSEAWLLLTYSYLRRASMATGPKADADYLSAIKAGEALTRQRSDEQAVALLGQALVGAKQYQRAATTLERVTTGDNVQASTLYLLGVAYSRLKNFPKAIAAFERAASKDASDVNIHRELGYAYEITKQYKKALDTYQKAAELSPADTDFKASVNRVTPMAK
jgi:tetratricopeptide (TPR) repeat protein